MNKYQEVLDKVMADLNRLSSIGWHLHTNADDIEILQELANTGTPQETGIRYSVINPEWTAEVCGECDYLISKDDVYCPMCGQKIGWRVEDD